MVIVLLSILIGGAFFVAISSYLGPPAAVALGLFLFIFVCLGALADELQRVHDRRTALARLEGYER